MPTPTRPERAELRGRQLREREERAREREALRRGPGAPGRRPPRSGRPWLKWGVVAAGALAFGAVCGYALRDAGLQLATTGPAAGAHLGAAATEDLRFRIAADLPSLMDTASLEYDGADVLDEAHIADGTLTYRPRDLTDGTHRLAFSIDLPFGPGRAHRDWTFTVDRTRPRIEILAPSRPAVRGAPVTLAGRVDEASTVTVDDAPVDVGRDGSFSVDFPEPPAGAISVRAVDLAGNSRGIRTSIPLAPRAPLVPTRAVHVTAISWAVDSLREPVLDMLRSGRINTVELDLKDESGIVGYDSKLAFANQIGAVDPSYEIAEAVSQIHDLGGRVVGRIVAFRDPVLARYAWDNGNREQVIQGPGGVEYQGYGGFTNFADPVVRKYNIDLALEATRAGVDDILYDYIRRPDGPLSTMVFPGLRGGAQRSIVSFLAEARAALDPTGAFLGASVFGIAAFRPEEVAQDVRRMARNVDYIAPLVYPSGWAPGSFGVSDPARSPGEITRKALDRFQEQVQGSGARLVPWLQDFSLNGVIYGPREVRAQLTAAEAVGVGEWIFWNPNVLYSRAGFPKG
jgi:hypothetical protein